MVRPGPLTEAPPGASAQGPRSTRSPRRGLGGVIDLGDGDLAVSPRAVWSIVPGQHSCSFLSNGIGSYVCRISQRGPGLLCADLSQCPYTFERQLVKLIPIRLPPQRLHQDRRRIRISNLSQCGDDVIVVDHAQLLLKHFAEWRCVGSVRVSRCRKSVSLELAPVLVNTRFCQANRDARRYIFKGIDSSVTIVLLGQEIRVLKYALQLFARIIHRGHSIGPCPLIRLLKMCAESGRRP